MKASDYPFSKDIIANINDYPEFKQSLKLYNTDRFSTFHKIIISYPEHLVTDQVIGVFYFDKLRGIYVQDYIVKQGGSRVVHFTRTGGQHRLVRNIKEFEIKYAVDGQYRKKNGELEHHYESIEDLPKELRQEAYEIRDSRSR